jgi:protein-S-isoprenylcysteine O-methyltransferase Ste14
MVHNEAARAALLLVPIFLWIGLFLRGPYSTREHTGALLAAIWQFQASLIISLVFMQGHFDLSLLLGEAALLGAINFLLIVRKSIVLGSVASAILLSAYAIESNSFALWFSATFFLACLPSILLGNWTANATHIYLRSILQTLCWACVLLWLFPFTVFHQLGEGWESLLNRSAGMNIIFHIPMILPGCILLGAAYQFAIEGNGTGFPYDPPDKLVAHGIYGHISNPMQLGICMLMLFWGVALMSYWICASAIIAIFLFIIFKDICNGSCAVGKTDKNWLAYQSNVPRWLPRFKAWPIENSISKT